MSILSADQMLANAIWRQIWDPRKIYSKSQIQQALKAMGINRTQSTMFNIGVRRLLEDKAEKKGMALVIERGCVFVTLSEWEILHKTVRMLRYYTTLGESIGHEGRGVNTLMSSADTVSREMGSLAALAGLQSHLMRDALNQANEVIATTFEDGRAAANAAFAKARAKTL